MKFRVVHPLALVQVLVILPALGVFVGNSGCEHRVPNQQVESPKIVAADSVSYGYPVVEAKVRRNLAAYDSLLALKGAKIGGPVSNYYMIGVYNRSAMYLQEAIEEIEQAGNVAPPDYIGLAELARSTVGPRYHKFLNFTTMDYLDGKDWHRLAQMGAAYSSILERGLGQATRK